VTSHQIRKPLLGRGNVKPVGFGPSPFEGRLLVATDGLFKYGKADTLEEITRAAPIRETAWRLVDSVRLPSGNLQDDATVHVFEQRDDRDVNDVAAP
jgi:serine/threonine protein phosphatase PrpC